MASGVKVDDDAKIDFMNMKGKKMYNYLIFHITDKYTVIRTADKGLKGTQGDTDSYEEFVAKLEEAGRDKKCRYGIYDFAYEKKGQNKNKLIFILWNPDDATLKEKMLYASSKSALCDALKENGKFEQVNDIADLERDKVTNEVLLKDKV